MKLAFYRSFCFHGTWKEILLDVLIGVFSIGRYSHVELVFSDGECFSSSIREDGVRFKKIDIDNDRWDVIALPRFHRDVEIEALLREDALREVGKGYDKWGAFTSILPFCVQRSKLLFCSEMIINMFHKRRVIQLLIEEHGVHAWHYTPIGDGCRYSPARMYKKIREIVR
jgi:hypothetical protein